MQNRLRSRVKEAVSRLRDDPSRADTDRQHANIFSQREASASPVRGAQEVPEQLRSSNPQVGARRAKDQEKSDLHPLSAKNDIHAHPEPKGEPRYNPSTANPALQFRQLEPLDPSGESSPRPDTLTQNNTPLHLVVDEQHVDLDTQIQLYATNGQLCHPWVSPVLGYLGGLPPLYICCGSNEVLRDEIIYA